MAKSHTELLEIILRECSRAQPHPWYPAISRNPPEYRASRWTGARSTAAQWFGQADGLVQDHGQGYQITPEGEEVLRQARLLARLRAGDVPMAKPAAEPVDRSRHALQGMRGEMVRGALMDGSRPVITQALMVLNCLWFLVGWPITPHITAARQ